MRRHTGFIGLILFCCNCVFAADDNAINVAINRGVTWVVEHPATCEDGGFLDVVDEGLFYLTIKRLTSIENFGSRLQRAFDQCISRLEASPEFERGLKKQNKMLIDHYHLLLATHVIEMVRKKQTASRSKVIEDAQRTLEISHFENPTFNLTVALLLRHLGAAPRISMDKLLRDSLINHVARAEDSLPFFQHPLVYYALVHEIAALTDFGRLPVTPWLMDRRAPVGRALREGLRGAVASSHVDLLAEILLCHHMLSLPVTEEIRDGVDFLVARQRADGSWGEQETPRSNRTRHAVLTATAALMAYKAAITIH